MAEKQMLETLDFDLMHPTSYNFLSLFAPTPCLLHMAQYLVELCLLETSSLFYIPSMLAAAAVSTAAQLFDSGEKRVVLDTGYT